MEGQLEEQRAESTAGRHSKRNHQIRFESIRAVQSRCAHEDALALALHPHSDSRFIATVGGSCMDRTCVASAGHSAGTAIAMAGPCSTSGLAVCPSSRPPARPSWSVPELCDRVDDKSTNG